MPMSTTVGALVAGMATLYDSARTHRRTRHDVPRALAHEVPSALARDPRLSA